MKFSNLLSLLTHCLTFFYILAIVKSKLPMHIQ